MGKLRALGLTTLLGQMASMFINAFHVSQQQKHDQKEEEDPLTLVDGNINGCGHHREQYTSSSKKKPKNRATISSCNPTPGHIYLEETIILKDACVPMFTEALITIAKTWKQCPSVEEGIKKRRYRRGRDKKEAVLIMCNGTLLSREKE